MLERDTLIQEFYQWQGSQEIEKIDSLIVRIETYISVYGEDIELKLVSKVLQISKHEHLTHNFEECSNTAEFIFETVRSIDTWSLLVIKVLGVATHYCRSYIEAHNLTQEALDILEDDFADCKSIDSTKFMYCTNMTFRLGRAIYKDLNPASPNSDKIEKIKELFYYYLNTALEICDKHNLALYKRILALRKALFENDFDSVFGVFATFNKDDKNEKELLKAMHDEALEYFYHSYYSLSTCHRNFFTGLLLRRKREELDIPPLDIAIALDTDIGAINKLENGARGIGYNRIDEISKVLKVDPSYFRGNIEGIPDSYTDPLMRGIGVATKGATEEERADVLALVTSYMANARRDRLK